jgi:muramoyltetrapeptide carboxypeptidase
MLKPRALRAGDRIAVVSPASPFAREEFDRGVEELRRMGFDPVWNDSVFARAGYVSGNPATRAGAFLDAWRDPSIRALIAVRGGYGSVQLLPYLDCTGLQRTPKAFIGYSDNTTLLAWLTTSCGIVSFHGPMLERRLSRGDDGFHRDSFLKAVTDPAPMGALEPPGLRTIKAGEAAGPLVGGTLTQLLASLGTPYAFDPPDRSVLFLEDVSERPYRIDRMLTQCRLSGMFERAAAVVFGEMRSCDEPGGAYTAEAVATNILADFPGPVLFGFPSGHATGPCWTLPFGVRTRVIADARPRLIVEEGAVS